jgi:hypothetical protein
LSPYDREVVPSSILKIEAVNYDPTTKALRPLYAFAISAKRYALFTREAGGGIEIVSAKEHGLGHLLWPYPDTRSEAARAEEKEKGRRWIREIWWALVEEALGQPLRLPAWVEQPVMTRIAVSTPGLLNTYATFNEGKAYADQVKPMNFGLSPTIARFGHPAGVDPERFHLVGSYEKDPAKWLTMTWYDKYSGKAYRIGVGRDTPPDALQVKTYEDVIREYRVHPEPKSLDAEGKPCDRTSRGLLGRRPVLLRELFYVGKESNIREQVEQGLVHARQEVQPSYPAPNRQAWDLIYQPAMRCISLARLVQVSGLGRRQLWYIRRGQRGPSPEAEVKLRREAERWARQAVRRKRLAPEVREVAERVLAAAPPLSRPKPGAALRPARWRRKGGRRNR